MGKKWADDAPADGTKLSEGLHHPGARVAFPVHAENKKPHRVRLFA
jgi:hypothetical protein